MQKVNDKFKWILEEAIGMEQAGERFYRNAEKETPIEQGRAIYKMLADDERVHIDMITKEYNSINKEGRWSDMVYKNKSHSIPKIFAKDKTKNGKKEGIRDAITVIKEAISHEEKGTEYYKRQADIISDPKGKAFYTFLMEEEKRHRQILQEYLDFLLAPDSWVSMEDRMGSAT